MRVESFRLTRSAIHFLIVTMPHTFRTQRRVEFVETDMAGIVHFSNFYRWMEQTEHEFFRSLGLSIMTHLPDGTVLGWPRVSANCRFIAPARYEDVIDVELSVQRIGVKSVTWDCRFSKQGEPLAAGTMKTVSCVVRHGQGLESVAIPPEFLAQLEERPAEDT